MDEAAEELNRFIRGERDPAGFSHREHVRMAFEMLRRHEFVETAYHYSLALRRMLERAGHPEAFHQTVTIAFLSLVAERMDRTGESDFEVFTRTHPDLFEGFVLGKWYAPERLDLPAARRSFLLPEPAR